MKELELTTKVSIYDWDELSDSDRGTGGYGSSGV